MQGTTSDFGNIDKTMWYSSNVGGVATLITLNNYMPFHEGEVFFTLQFKYLQSEYKAPLFLAAINITYK